MLELSLPKYIHQLLSLEMLGWNLIQKAVSESDSTNHPSDDFLTSHFATLVSRFFRHTYFNSLLSGTGDVSDYTGFLYLTRWATLPFEA